MKRETGESQPGSHDCVEAIKASQSVKAHTLTTEVGLLALCFKRDLITTGRRREYPGRETPGGGFGGSESARGLVRDELTLCTQAHQY